MRLASFIFACLILWCSAFAGATKVYRSAILIIPNTKLQAQVDAAGENVVLACAVGETYSAPTIKLKRGQVLQGNQSRWTGTVYAAPNGRVEGVHFIGVTSGVILTNCWCVTVRDCVFNGSSVGVAIRGTDSVVDVSIDRCRLSNGQYGVLVEGGAHISVRVRDCAFEGYPFGVCIQGYTIGAQVSGCHFESIRSADIVVDNGDATSTIIRDNVHIRPVCPVALVRGNGCVVRDSVIRGTAQPKVQKEFVRAVIE